MQPIQFVDRRLPRKFVVEDNGDCRVTTWLVPDQPSMSLSLTPAKCTCTSWFRAFRRIYRLVHGLRLTTAVDVVLALTLAVAEPDRDPLVTVIEYPPALR